MKTLRPALLLLLLALPARAQDQAYLSELSARARAAGLAREPAWLRLLHYRGGRSEADGPRFFLSPRGRSDAAAELEADLAAFFQPPPAKGQHPQCLFPARYHWLKGKLAFDPARLPERPCPDFEAWRGDIDAGGVTLVFASAFLNNPASMFGHTFLRLRRKGAGPGDPLLDYTINFAATPTTDNMLLSTLGGLNGSFKGEYSLQPFYMKTQEYNSLEMRDLWEYPLNLTQDQVDFLVMHGWEMGSTWFDYYFFTKNCSYQLLTFLEAGIPSLDASAAFKGAVVPVDTLRALQASPGLVGPGRFRPSFVTEMKARRARLTGEDAELASSLGRRADEAGLARARELPPERRALVLESAHDYLLYRTGVYEGKKSDETLAADHALLVERGAVKTPPAPLTVPPPEPAERGHATMRAGAGAGASTFGPWQELSWRGALHDLTEDYRGYDPAGQLAMADLQLRYDDKGRRPYLEKLTLVEIQSLTPLDKWVREPSWRVATGVEQAKELGKRPVDSMIYDATGSGGLALRPDWALSPLFYVLADADLGLGPALAQSWRLGAGGTAGLRLSPARWWRLLVDASYTEYWQRSPARQRLRLQSSWSLNDRLDLRVTLDRRVPDSEAGGSLLYHF